MTNNPNSYAIRPTRWKRFADGFAPGKTCGWSLDQSPTIQEMGKKLSLSPRQIRSVVDAHEAAKPVGSLDMPLDEDENLYLRDMLTDSSERGPERIFSILRGSQ